MKRILILLLAIITLSSCEKITNTTWVYYDETGCADPWIKGDITEEEKKKNVVKYFEDKSIKIRAIEILNDGILEGCYACHFIVGLEQELNVV